MSLNSHALRSPVTGSVVDLLVLPGARVASGQELVIISAMKMEIPVAAPGAGQVASVVVQDGMPVTEGQVLMHLHLDGVH